MLSRHQLAILTDVPIGETLGNLVDAFEQLGLYLLDKREATPEIATQYCSILLIISSTVATLNLSAELQLDLQGMDSNKQETMQNAAMELAKRLQFLFVETFGFTPPQMQA